MVDFHRRWSISAVCGRFKEKSTVGGRLRKKKERRRRGEVPRAALAATPPGVTREPSPPAGDFSPHAGESSRRPIFLKFRYILVFSPKPGKRRRVVIRVVDLRPLERRSIVKADSLEGRGIGSGRMAVKTSDYRDDDRFWRYRPVREVLIGMENLGLNKVLLR
ncbi:hypothetical protein GW17_00028528 [Ensete ventricosum]|nr:hypothetical protein GW17_00028528 [Ensete ventricosum]